MAEPQASPIGVEVAPGVNILPSALNFSFSRSGGPGGQNVNKVSTKAELRFRPEQLIGISTTTLERLKFQQARFMLRSGELQIICDEERSQERNRQRTLEKLREMIVRAQVNPKPRYKTKPTRSSRETRLKAKKERSEVKQGRSYRFERW